MKLLLVIYFSISYVYAGSLLPKCFKGEEVRHQYYSLCYQELHEQPSWTAHQLTKASINGPQKRTNNFRVDPLVSTQSVGPNDYKNSGYDRGHLIPAGDMKLNKVAMSETFFMSNMSPQVPGFNRGVWNKIENLVRRWANDYNEVFVVTGPVLEPGLPTLKDQISIPRYYYKIVYVAGKKPKMLGFLIENKVSQEELKTFVVSVDEIERKTGIDFFYQMSLNEQKILESEVDLTLWPYL